MEPNNESIRQSQNTVETELYSAAAFHIDNNQEFIPNEQHPLKTDFAELKKFMQVTTMDHMDMISYSYFRKVNDIQELRTLLAASAEERDLAYQWLQDRGPAPAKGWSDCNLNQVNRSVWMTCEIQGGYRPEELLRLTERVHEREGIILVHQDEAINVPNVIKARDNLVNCDRSIADCDNMKVREELAYSAGSSACVLLSELHVLKKEDAFLALDIQNIAKSDQIESFIRGFTVSVELDYDEFGHAYPGSAKDKEQRTNIADLVEDFRRYVEQKVGDHDYVLEDIKVKVDQHELEEEKRQASEHGLSLGHS